MNNDDEIKYRPGRRRGYRCSPETVAAMSRGAKRAVERRRLLEAMGISLGTAPGRRRRAKKTEDTAADLD